MAQTAAIVIRGPRTPASAVIGFGLIWAFLILFVLYPLTRIFYDAFSDEAGRLTFANFHEFFTDRYYLRSLWNSLALGVATVITTSVIGIAVAFLIIRFEFPGRNLFSYLAMLPMILPPLVGVLGFVFILGRAGTVNVLLHDGFGLTTPINFMYGMHGVLLVETLHLFPFMTLSILDSLSKVDPSLEEAAQVVGANGWRRFRDVTLPLTTPGYVSGALLVFIWTFADFVTPLVVGVQDLLAVGFLVMLMLASLLPQAGVVLAAVGKGWSLTPLPEHYTLDHFRQVSLETPRFIINSLLYSGLAVLICLGVGVPMAWIMARTRTPGRGAMDARTTLILAIPGTAIGIAYIRAFHYPLP